MGATVKISVVIPTFNRAVYLPVALDSVFAQQVEEMEVIVVDDASTDETTSVLARYGSRIRTIRRRAHSNCLSRVLNDGVSAARGEYVAFLDSDDMWLPDKLARQLPLLDGDGGCGVAYGNFVFLDGEVRTPPAVAANRLPAGWILSALVEDMFVHPSTVIVRRTLLESVGGFDEAAGTAEHYDLQLRLARLARAVSVLAPLAIVRRHSGQHSRTRIGDNYRSAIVVLEHVVGDPKVARSIRRLARRTIARHHTTLARLLLNEGRGSVARKHIRAALSRYPLSRAAWFTGLRTLGRREGRL
jgi:GT2 family glycosyltransferase